MIIGFFAFGALVFALRWPKLVPSLLVMLLPAYLLRTTIFGIPTTALEVSIVAAGGGLLFLLVTKRLAWHFVAMTRWTWGLLVTWVVAWGIATIFSIDRTASLGALKAWLIDPLLVVAILSVLVTTHTERIRLIQGIVLSGCSVAVVGIVQFLFFHASLQDGRLSSYFFPVANYAAMFIGPTLIVTLGGIFQQQLSRRWWIAALIQAIALLLTMSYGGFLATAVAGVFLVVFLPNKKIRKTIVLTGAVVGVLFFATLTQTRNFREHFAPDRSSSLVRAQIWATSTALIRQHPLTGIGPNTFEQAYRKEVPKHYFPPLEWLVAQPHNLYLALWLETGLLGLLGFLVLLVYHTWFIGKTFFQRTPDRAIAIISLAGLLAVIVHGFVDTPYFKNDLAIEFLVIAILPWLGQKKSV